MTDWIAVFAKSWQECWQMLIDPEACAILAVAVTATLAIIAAIGMGIYLCESVQAKLARWH